MTNKIEKVLSFEEYCQEQQKKMKCVFPSNEDCYLCETRIRKKEIDQLKKRIRELESDKEELQHILRVNR